VKVVMGFVVRGHAEVRRSVDQVRVELSRASASAAWVRSRGRFVPAGLAARRRVKDEQFGLATFGALFPAFAISLIPGMFEAN
jgi:hypothetical protein